METAPDSPGPQWAGGGSVASALDAGQTGARPYTPRLVSRRPLGCLVEIAETLVLTLVIFLVIQTFVAQPYQVQQESMRITLEEGQYVLVDKLTPHFDSYSRGDIVVFQPPGDGAEAVPFIKRVIGIGGDRVGIRDGTVYVNEVALDEPYVFGGRTTAPEDTTDWTVPADSVFVMGDNRNNSTDSRSSSIGPVPVANVIGRAWLRYWPLNTLGILPTPTYPEVPAPAQPTSRVRLTAI